MKTISISKSISTAVAPSRRVLATGAMFGVGLDDNREMTIVPPCEIPLLPRADRGTIVFITGPSGSGKSTILKLMAQQCVAHGMEMLALDQLPPLPEKPLVDALAQAETSLEQVMSLMSLSGLSDALVMMRRPSELSEGQRARARLAQLFAAARQRIAPPSHQRVMLADEFGSTLDRVTACAIARNVRKWMNRPEAAGQAFVAATAHDDVLEALQPDVLVWKGLNDQIEVLTR